MKLGVSIFATDYAMRPDEFARACEERGFESVWYPEHTHIPTSRRTPYPLGGDLPKEYWHIHDLFVALTAAAAATKTIKIGSGICLVIERDPIVLAKEVASVDQLSNGRLIFGIGGGWNAEEMENHGTPFKQLPAMVRDLRSRAEKVGRRPAEISISVLGVQGDEAALHQYRELGAERAIFFVPSAGREQILPLLDQYAALIPKVA